MTIARTVVSCLQMQGIPYEIIAHPYRETARETAESARVPPGALAKAVMLSDRRGYLMAVLPADRHVSFTELWRRLGRRLTLAAETRLPPVFTDCETGAIPPLGPAYGIETIVDDSLVGLPDVYFESGDHRGLIRVRGERFLALLRDAEHGHFAH